METALSELPDDIESLKKLVVETARHAHELEATSKQLKEENAALQLKLLEVTDKYETLQRQFFGASSEKRKKEEDNPKQALLFNEAETYAEAPPKPEKSIPVRSHERKVRGRKPLPANLERREFVHALSEAERTCPSCGAVRPEIGQEVREELEFIPARFVCLMSTEFPWNYHEDFPIVINGNSLVSSSACLAGGFVMHLLPQAESQLQPLSLVVPCQARVAA